jgi:adenylate kinase
LVGDEIMISLVAERLEQDDARSRGYILDGFPRTVVQAEALDRISADLPIDAVLDIDVPRDMVIQRISARRTCRDCGANYTAKGVERSTWTCDTCGGDVVQRADDTPDAINRRLDLYESQTSPLLDYYDRQGRLTVIDGSASPDEVFARLTAAIDAARRRS